MCTRKHIQECYNSIAIVLLFQEGSPVFFSKKMVCCTIQWHSTKLKKKWTRSVHLNMNTFHNIYYRKRATIWNCLCKVPKLPPKKSYTFFRGVISEKKNQSKRKCLLYSKTLKKIISKDWLTGSWGLVSPKSFGQTSRLGTLRQERKQQSTVRFHMRNPSFALHAFQLTGQGPLKAH